MAKLCERHQEIVTRHGCPLCLKGQIVTLRDAVDRLHNQNQLLNILKREIAWYLDGRSKNRKGIRTALEAVRAAEKGKR